jgi:YtkA-like
MTFPPAGSSAGPLRLLIPAVLVSLCLLGLYLSGSGRSLEPLPVESAVASAPLATPPVVAAASPAQVPDGLNLSPERTSKNGFFSGKLRSETQPPPLETLHSWTLELADERGIPVSGAQLRVDGGMPRHSHGLPTQPKVRTGEGEGVYVVEGVRFHMRGWWQLTFVVEAEGRSDVLTFDFVLE